MPIKCNMPINNRISPFYNARQQGFTLIEVLTTVVISGIALMGLAGLQISAVNSTTVASANTHTMIAIKEIVGQMIANREAAKAGQFNIAAADSSGHLQSFSTDLEPTSDTPALAEMITYKWFNNLNHAVPGAKAGIHCSVAGLCVVKVQLSEAVDNLEQIIAVQL